MPLVANQGEMNDGTQLTFSLLAPQSRMPVCGEVPPTLKIAFPQLSLLGNILKDKNVCLPRDSESIQVDSEDWLHSPSCLHCLCP